MFILFLTLFVDLSVGFKPKFKGWAPALQRWVRTDLGGPTPPQTNQ